MIRRRGVDVWSNADSGTSCGMDHVGAADQPRAGMRLPPLETLILVARSGAAPVSRIGLYKRARG